MSQEETGYYHPKSVQKSVLVSLENKYALKNTFAFIDDIIVNLNHAIYWSKLFGDPVLVSVLEKMQTTCENILKVKK